MASGKIKNQYSINYAGTNAIITTSGDSYTITKKGYVYARASNGATTATKPLLRIRINGIVIFEQSGRDETYAVVSSGIYPVDVGDVVQLSDGTFTNLNRVFFVSAE